MTKLLFVRPAHDDVTAYLYYYSKELLNEAERRGFISINKEKKEAVPGIIHQVIEKIRLSFIMFNGHGSPAMICGHNDEIIIQLGKNHHVLKNRITYSLTCSSAAGVGQEVADSDTTFIGYRDDFALGMDVHSQAAVHRDQRARLFLEPSNLLVKSLLKGNTAQEAVEKSRELIKRNISLLRTDPFPDAKDYIPYLFNNYLILEVLGNNQARLPST